MDDGRLDEVAQLQITEADLEESAPRVRALLVARYEQLWRPVAARLALDDDGTQPIDPRMLELGIRVCKEQAAMYRLARTPTAAVEDEAEPIGGLDRINMIEAKLREVEDKARATKGP